MAVTTIQVNTKLLDLAAFVEKDVSKVINEALNLWLTERILICPITKKFCTQLSGSCNNCKTAMKGEIRT